MRDGYYYASLAGTLAVGFGIMGGLVAVVYGTDGMILAVPAVLALLLTFGRRKEGR